MNLQQEHHVVVHEVCQALKKARWIDAFSGFGKDIRIHWTDIGLCRKSLLRQVVRDFHLTENISSAYFFTKACKSFAATSGEFQRAASEFWLTAYEELDLPLEQETIWTLACIVADEAFSLQADDP